MSQNITCPMCHRYLSLADDVESFPWHGMEYSVGHSYRCPVKDWPIEDFAVPSEEDEFGKEREALALAIHKKVNSSVQYRTVPFLIGDAERAVAAVIEQGWRPE